MTNPAYIVHNHCHVCGRTKCTPLPAAKRRVAALADCGRAGERPQSRLAQETFGEQRGCGW